MMHAHTLTVRSIISALSLALVLSGGMPGIFGAKTAYGQQLPGAHSLRLEVPGVGNIIVRPVSGAEDEGLSQLLLEKPGGSRHVLASLEALDFVTLLKGDLDGDQNPEVIAIARNRGGDELMPYIFGGSGDLKQIFPPGDEGNPLIGKEISLAPGPQGLSLVIKVPVNFHDFGPPDLYNLEYYRLHGEKLEKVGEKLQEGTHFNQKLNMAGYAFSKNNYLEALKEYEAVIASDGARMPAAARAEAFFAQAECRKIMKDFVGAAALYQKVVDEFPEAPQQLEAKRESVFLKANLAASQTLSLYIDVSQLNRLGQSAAALELLDKSKAIATDGPLSDHLAFLRGEILIALGRIEDAVKFLQGFRKRFPASILRDRVEATLQDLQGKPDEDHGDETLDR
ncbi:MAG: tetratricopeptide repeat protein [Candidatus Riflebacteria bacterium]|nr:tetratricopeptide repeat protein [Candidatus Riflebacteria bacterium]